MNVDTRTRTQRFSDDVAEFCGSWSFIIWFSVIIVLWMAIQGRGTNFDPYPYLLLNYALTITSTMQSPIIMMSQNRQVERDREHIKGLHVKLDQLIGCQTSATEIQLLRNAVLAAQGIRFETKTRFVVPETMNNWFIADKALWEFQGKSWEDRGNDD